MCSKKNKLRGVLWELTQTPAQNISHGTSLIHTDSRSGTLALSYSFPTCLEFSVVLLYFVLQCAVHFHFLLMLLVLLICVCALCCVVLFSFIFTCVLFFSFILADVILFYSYIFCGSLLFSLLIVVFYFRHYYCLLF